MALHCDEVPYGDLAFFHTHPNHLASVGVLCGLPAPPVESCRMLEVACGTGFNSIAIGRSLPNARFVGIDLSAKQIDHGRALAIEAGVANVELLVGRLEEIGAEFGEFDYIVAHGIFSWVPPDLQSALLRLIRDRLAPHGLGYISYNTLPGWNTRGILRDAMRLLEPRDRPAGERVALAKERVRHLIETLPEPESTYRQLLQDELQSIEGEEDYYILNEYLADFNRPTLFTNFAGMLAEHGLQFVAESRFGTSSFAQIGEDRKALDAAGDDLVRREQYHDIRWRRYFRQSLVCRAERTVPRSPDPREVERLWLHPRVELVEPIGDVDETEADEARREEDGEIVRIHDPLYRRILRRLTAAPGSLLPMPAFEADVAELVPFEIGPEKARHLLARAIVKGAIEEVWHLYATEPRFAKTAGERPLGCPLARRQAQTSLKVTNKLHRTVRLTEAERALLLALDGTRTRDELAREHTDPGRTLARLATLAVLDA